MFIRKKTHQHSVELLREQIDSLKAKLAAAQEVKKDVPKTRYIEVTFDDGSVVKHAATTFKQAEKVTDGFTLRGNDPTGEERTVAWYNKIPIKIISTWE